MKNSLVLEYCQYVKKYMYIHCENWFKSHSLQDYPSKKTYMNDFLKYDACGNSSESRPITALEIIS